MPTGHLHIGTSGWQYRHWRCLFYPQGLVQSKELAYYAGVFGATEINSSFYRLPSAATVGKWVGEVPARFKFCPKISRWVTHAKKLNDPETGVPSFFDVFDAYRKHCGPVLVQLPANVAFASEKVRYFFDYLRANYPQWKFSLEARHDSWTAKEAVQMLEKYRVGWVIVDAGKRWPSKELVTARHVYVRLHGPDGSYATKYTDTALSRLAQRCKKWSSEGHDCWVFFNNDIHGYAVDNAARLRRLIDEP